MIWSKNILILCNWEMNKQAKFRLFKLNTINTNEQWKVLRKISSNCKKIMISWKLIMKPLLKKEMSCWPKKVVWHLRETSCSKEAHNCHIQWLKLKHQFINITLRLQNLKGNLKKQELLTLNLKSRQRTWSKIWRIWWKGRCVSQKKQSWNSNTL